MNEFIVWDEDRKIWIDESYPFFINCYGLLCLQKNDKQMILESNCKAFFPIGKTDINGKKIYAESSILKINHFIDSRGKQYYMYRKVSWSEKYSAWVVKTLDDKEEWLYYVFEKNAKNTQIIDTIQENKLGLIK